jgi:hypothetical protein
MFEITIEPNLIELKADGPAGHFEGLSLCLYNPESLRPPPLA